MESEGLFNCLIFNIMKKIITSILALSLIVSCQINELASEHGPADDNLYASIEPVNTTKTVMDDNNNVLWSDGDKLVAFMKTTLGVKYQIMEQFVGTTTGGFSKLNEPGNEDDLESGQELDHNVVLYPHSYDVWCMKNDDNVPTQSYRLNVMLPEAQSYEENTFGIGTFPMIAVSPDNKLTFRNICGGLKLQFKGVDKIKSIKLEGLGGEKISGKSTVVGYVDGSAPVITMSSDDESYSHVILDCGEGVQLSETAPTTFIIAVPPMEFASGLKITVTDTDGLSRTLKNSSSNTIKRSSLLTFPVITYEPETPDPESVDLSEDGTANSYIVSASGAYKFCTVKGNSSESVGAVASAEVLWESFGTDVTPNVGDLVKNAAYSEGYITFQTAETFKEGNAVIAAKDASGTILWSWHIWLTDEPEGQVYYNNAGTMMDRNLGATSATPGDVEALGLFYQWGRKDPFLGLSSISEAVEAISTITWPSAEKSNAIYGTIEYATANPTTFITSNDSNYDWYYTGSDSTDNTRWTTSETKKSIYDPCPVGWRVPDGGKDGVWSRAGFEDTTYDSTNQGISFSISSPSTTWYPGSIYRHRNSGSLNHISCKGFYWSASPYKRAAHYLLFNRDGSVNPSYYDYRAYGSFVRCAREESVPSTPDPEPVPESVNLSEEGTANSYIVSSAGLYKFSTVKGNSSESVGTVASAEVLWETFGTDVTPNIGDLVKNTVYSDGYITFQTAETFKEGNAVIAAKDASGNILWSWHIWLTDEPEGQVYYNNAGTIMDRNLGATSATPGDVGALGLLYQWGRKDPFLGSSSISSSSVIAKSTITWPSKVGSEANGTIAYAIAHPTTFIYYNSRNYDWCYTSSSSTDNTRWTTSESNKSIYDPCPAGWRVPDGGGNGIWSKSLGSSSSFNSSYNINEGMNFSDKFCADQTIWYPASGYRHESHSDLVYVGEDGYYWSASPCNKYVYVLNFRSTGGVDPSTSLDRAYACSVRCIKE